MFAAAPITPAAPLGVIAYRFQRPKPPCISVSGLRDATWEELEVAFGHTDGKGATTTGQVKPLGLVYFDHSTVLIAWCKLRRDVRVFRLDRMSDLEITDQSFGPHRVLMLPDALAKIRAQNRAMQGSAPIPKTADPRKAPD